MSAEADTIPRPKPRAKKAAKKTDAIVKGAQPDDIELDIEDDEVVDEVVELEDDEGADGNVPESLAKDQTERMAKAQAQEEQEKTEEDIEAEIEEARLELEKLEPSDEPVQWEIGKPPVMGGTDKTFSIYVQRKLAWMPRQRFFALVTKTMSNAIKEAGSDATQMAEVFGGEGSLLERGRRLSQRDFTDAASFFTLAMELVAYSPKFLIDCYLIWLDVPRDDRGWARQVFDTPWDPDNGYYGLKDEDHEKLIATFIDQNYEEIRRFFVVTLPGIGRRVALHEKSRDRRSKSDQWK